MPSFWSKLKKLWNGIFFWQTPSDSGEFKPEAHHDHALVLAVTEKKQTPSWRQWRFFARVLPTPERRLFVLSALIAVVAVIAGIVSLLVPHLTRLPSEGGTLVEAVAGTPKLINPLYAPSSRNDIDRDLTALVYSGLFRVDANLNPQPDLVQEYQWLDGGKTLQVSLRADARFHDGQLVTADDVVFTYQSILNPDWRSPLARLFKGIKVVRVDDQTVQFQLDAPRPTLPLDLTVGILPAHIWQDIPADTANIADANLKPIGSGPYHVASFKRDSRGVIVSYELEAFRQYYGIKPLIQNLDFKFFDDRDQAMNALKTDQADTLAFASWEEANDLAHTSAIDAVKLKLPLMQTVAFFNTKDNLLKDDSIRKAFTLAIDRTEWQSQVGDQAQAISSSFPGIVTTTSTEGDLNAARAALDKLGWKLDPQTNVRSLAPKKPTTGSSTSTAATSSTVLTVSIDVPNQPDLLRAAQWLQRRWSLLGADVKISQDDPDTLRHDAATSRNYQVIVWNILPTPNQDISQFWSSSQANERGLNWSNISDRDVDNALLSVAQATSTDAVAQARGKLATVLDSRHAAIFLANPYYAYLVNDRIHGTHDLTVAKPADRFLQMIDWYVTTQWRWK